MYLEKEISEQPQVLQNLLNTEADNIKVIVKAIREFDPTFISVAARGTSDNAARYTQYIFGVHAKLAVGLAAPSLHTLYGTPPNLSRALVMGISQSGQAEDVRQVLEDAKAQGALTISITNDKESPLANEADHHIFLNAGEEISIAATKTYTSQLMAVAMLLAILVDNTELKETITKIPLYASETIFGLTGAPIIETSWVERYRYLDHFATIGRGYNYCTAFETNLKIKELCYITGDGYSEADFRHGPIATVHPGFPVISIAPEGKTLPAMLDLHEKLHEKNAELLIVSNNEEAFKYAQNRMKIPTNVPEWISPIITVIPGQIFAMRLAMVKGHEVDRPRGLNKVTVTK